MAEANPSSSGSDERQREYASGTGSQTETIQKEEKCQENNTPTLHLRLNQPKNGHKVKWSTDTIDNEFMGKKKSKCCCIYEKPKVFGESSSSSEDDGEDDGCTPHCKGHKKKCYRKSPHDPHDHNHQDADGGAGPGAGPSSDDSHGITS